MIPHFAIISSGRPGRVSEMGKHLGALAPLATWYVGADEEQDYRYAGAPNVVPAGDLPTARNTALEAAFKTDQVCCQFSDDLTGVQWTPDRERKYKVPMGRAVALVMGLGLTEGARLAGAAAVDNLFYLPKDDVSRQAFIIGDFSLHAPSPIRFDTNLTLKEDLSYSIDHLKLYGKVGRVNTVLANWQHRTNHGGAVQYRTMEREEAACRYIEEKHPGCTRRNPNREIPELLLVWPPKTGVSPLRGTADAVAEG